MLTKLKGKGIAHDEVDGLLPENKERRTQLFEASGLKGKYPQVFIVTNTNGAEDIKFVGDAEKFDELLEMDTIPLEILDANPDIVTFDMMFKDCEKL